MGTTTDRVTRNQIKLLEEFICRTQVAATQLATGAIQSYTLDTAQSRQVVTKATIGELQRAIDGALNQLAVLEQRLTGCGTVIVQPVT